MADREQQQYMEYLSRGISGNVTRGLVVDVNDPLQAGRVRVWIPLHHGGMIQNDPMSFDASVSGKAVSRLGDLSSSDSIACLPWAPVISNNWGPVVDLQSGTVASVFGVYNVPKIGTEVFLIFEDDDPNHPIVLGAVYHQSDLVPSQRKTPLLEITPGTTIATTPNLDYNGTVSQNYLIQSQNGSSLLLSDTVGQEEIYVGGSIGFFTTAETGDYSSQYQTFSANYPNFPTTQSAPYRTRNSLTNTSNPIINVNLLQPTVAPTTSLVTSLGTTTTTSPNTSATTSPTSSGTITKQLPFGQNISPLLPGPASTDGKAFYAKRANGEVHLGVDIRFATADHTTPLLAPINGTVILAQLSESAGNWIIFLGADGYCHTFCHLSAISCSVGQTYQVGSVLGHTGGQPGTLGAGNTTGPHLHWEVWNPSGATTNAAIINVRNVARKPSNIAGQTGYYPKSNGTLIFEDGVKTWLGKQVTGVNTQAMLGATQIDSYVQMYNTATDYTHDKPIGLEVSLNPGAEQIFLRHSSGAFLGFDPDGNFKLYTPGSADFKINRNLVFDVLGGIFNSCMAMYTRAREVIKFLSGGRPMETYHVNAFTDFPTDKNSSKILSKYNLPKIFSRIDLFRKNDMTDAITQSSSNVYYTLATGFLGKSASAIQTDGYAAQPDQDAINQINFNFSLDDGYIRTSWSTYIKNNNNPIASHITPKILKAMMLLACKGNPSPTTTDGLSGVFQLASIAATTIKGSSASLTSYLSPKDNIDLAVQFINSRANAMYTFLGSSVIYSDDSSGIIGGKEYAMRAVLMDYLYCMYTNTISTDIEYLYQSVVNGGGFSYPALEQSFATSSLLSDTSTYKNAVNCYGATIIAITNNSAFSI